MLLDIVLKGSTDRSVILRIIDSTDGTPETGVVFNTSGIDLWYRREGAAVVSITEATLAALTTAHTDGGFLHISHGYYRLDLPDAAFATGANQVTIGGTVTGMVVIGGVVRLVDFNPEAALALESSVQTAITNIAGVAAAAATAVWAAGTRTLTAIADSSGVTTLLGKLAGITLLAQWLGLIAGKQVGNSTARTELRATGAGSGTFDETTDSIEALRDNVGTAGAALTAVGDSAGITTLLGKFTGITVLAQWLGLIAGKQVGNSTARTELRATGAGSGTFDETTDSVEALRDRGDSAWITATGFSTLNAAGVRAAVGLASADLDTQLAALPTAAENAGQVRTELTTELGRIDDDVTSRASQASVDTIDGLVDGLVTRLVATAVTTGAVATNGGNSATSIDTTLTETADDHWKDAWMLLTSGALAGQIKRITAYDGTTKVLTVQGGFTGTPADAVTFALINR